MNEFGKVGPTMSVIDAAKIRYDDWKENLSAHESFYFAEYINVLLNDLNSDDIKVYPAASISENIEIQQIQEQGQQYAFIPLNVNYDNYRLVNNPNHWVALIVDKKNGRIFYLDPAEKNQIPDAVNQLKQILNYEELILNPIDFQSAEKGGKSALGLVHCGPYAVEAFAAIANKIKDKKSIVSDSSVENKDVDKVSITSVLSRISPASGEVVTDRPDIHEIRKKHANVVRQAILNVEVKKTTNKPVINRSQTQVGGSSKSKAQNIIQQSKSQRRQSIQPKRIDYKANVDSIEKGKRNIGFVYKQLSMLDVSEIIAALEKKIESNWFVLHKSLVEIKTSEKTFSEQAEQARKCLHTVSIDPGTFHLKDFERKTLQEAIQCFQELSVFEGPFSEITLDEKISFPQKADREGIIKALGLLEQKINDQNNIFSARVLNFKWLIMNEPVLRALILKVSPDSLSGFGGLLANITSALSTQEEQQAKITAKSDKKTNEYSLTIPVQRLTKLVLFAKGWHEKLEELGQPLEIVQKIKDKFEADANDAQDYLTKAQNASNDSQREFLGDFLLKEKKNRDVPLLSDKAMLPEYMPSERARVKINNVKKTLNDARKAIELIPGKDQNLLDITNDLNMVIDSLRNSDGYSVGGFVSLPEKLIVIKNKLDDQNIRIPDEATIKKIRLSLHNPLLGFVYSQLKAFVSLYKASHNIAVLVDALDCAWAGFYKMQKEEYVTHEFFVSDKNDVKSPREQSGKNLSLAQKLFTEALRLKGMIVLGDTLKGNSFIVEALKPLLAEFERDNLIPFEFEINIMKREAVSDSEYLEYKKNELKYFLLKDDINYDAIMKDEKTLKVVKTNFIDTICYCLTRVIDQNQSSGNIDHTKHQLDEVLDLFYKLQIIAPSQYQFFGDNKIDSPLLQTGKLSRIKHLFNGVLNLKSEINNGLPLSPENIAYLGEMLPDHDPTKSFEATPSEKYVLNKICNVVYSLKFPDSMLTHKALTLNQIKNSFELFKQHYPQFFEQNGEPIKQTNEYLVFSQELFNGLLEITQMFADSPLLLDQIILKADDLYLKRAFALDVEYACNHLLSYICEGSKVLLSDFNGDVNLSAMKNYVMKEIWKAFYLLQIKSQTTTKRYFFFDLHDQSKPLIQKGENLSFVQELFNAVYQFMDKKTADLSDLMNLLGILSKQNEQEEYYGHEPKTHKFAISQYINKSVLRTVPCPRSPENDDSKEKIKIHQVKDKSFIGAAFLGMVDHILCGHHFFETNSKFSDEVNAEIERSRQVWIDLFNRYNIDSRSDWTFPEVKLHFMAHNTYQAQQALKEKFVPILVAEIVEINKNTVFLDAYKTKTSDKIYDAFLSYYEELKELTANNLNSVYSVYTESSAVKNYFNSLCLELASITPVDKDTLAGISRKLRFEWTKSGGLAEKFLQHAAANSDSADREVIAEVCYDLGFFTIDNEKMEADLDKICLFVKAEKASSHEKAPQWVCKAAGSDFIKNKPSRQKYKEKEEVKAACKGAYLRSIHDVGVKVGDKISYFRVRQPTEAGRIIKADKVVSELYEKIKSEDNIKIIDAIESSVIDSFKQWDSQKPESIVLEKGDVSEHLRSAYNAYRLCNAEQKKAFKLADFNKNEVLGSYLSHVRNEILPLNNQLFVPWKKAVSVQGQGFVVWKKQPDAELQPSELSRLDDSMNLSSHIIETKDSDLNTVFVEAKAQEMTGKNAPLEYAPIYEITSSGVKHLIEETRPIDKKTVFFSWEWIKREIQELLFYQTEHRNNYALGLVPIDKYMAEINNKAAQIRVLLHMCVVSKMLVARQLILAPVMLDNNNATLSYVELAKMGTISLEALVKYFERDIEKLDKLCEIAELILNEGFIGDEPNEKVTYARQLLNEISGDTSDIYRCPFARKDLEIGLRRDFQFDKNNEATGVKTYDNLRYRKLQVIQGSPDERFRRKITYRVTPIGSALNVRIGTPLKLAIIKDSSAFVFIIMATAAFGAIGKILGFEVWKNAGGGGTPPTPVGPTSSPTTGEPLPPWITPSPSTLSPTISPENDLALYQVEYGSLVAGVSLAIMLGIYFIVIRPRVLTKVTSVEEVQPEGEYFDISQEDIIFSKQNDDVVIDFEEKASKLHPSELGGKRLPEQRHAKLEPSLKSSARLKSKELDSVRFMGNRDGKYPVKRNEIPDLSVQNHSQFRLRDLKVDSTSPHIADRLTYPSGEPINQQQKKKNRQARHYNLPEFSIATQKSSDLKVKNNKPPVSIITNESRKNNNKIVSRGSHLREPTRVEEKSIKSTPKLFDNIIQIETVSAKLDVGLCLDNVSAALIRITNIQGKANILTQDNLAKINKLSTVLTMLKQNPMLISDQALQMILLQVQVMEEMLGQPSHLSLKHAKLDLSKNKDMRAEAIYKTATDLAKSLNDLLNKMMCCEVFPDVKLKDKLPEIKEPEGLQHRYNSLRSYFSNLSFDQKGQFVEKHKASIEELKKFLSSAESGWMEKIKEKISGKEDILDSILEAFESDFQIKRALHGEKMVDTHRNLIAQKIGMGDINLPNAKQKEKPRESKGEDVDLEDSGEGVALGEISGKTSLSINAGKMGIFKANPSSTYTAFTKGQEADLRNLSQQTSINTKPEEHQPLIRKTRTQTSGTNPLYNTNSTSTTTTTTTMSAMPTTQSTSFGVKKQGK